jgi:dTDP-4-dehydrorhamnose reductase
MMSSPERSFGGRRILVTGGAGFVGGVVTRKLVEAGARVTVLDDLFTGKADTIPTGAEFVEGSVTDAALVDELVAANSLVFHLAARNIIASTTNPRDDFATNIGGTLNILMAARANKVDRVVYAGSASVYGNPRSIPINEDDFLVPLSPYAVSKLGARTTPRRSTRATACQRRASATATSTGPASGRTTPTAASSPSSSSTPTPAGRCRSTVTVSRPATTRTWTMPSRRPFSRRSGREPRVRSSTSGPGSRRP